MIPGIVATITAAAKATAVPPLILLSVCFNESSFRAVGSIPDGVEPSIGVCQVKLSTARDFIPNISVRALKEPAINAYVAGLYLRHQYEAYSLQWECAVSAYNRGSNPAFDEVGPLKGYSCITRYSRHVRKYMAKTPWLK